MTSQLSIAAQHRFSTGFEVNFQLELPLHNPRVTAVTGLSGSGKSTLLRILAGLQTVQNGRIRCGSELWVDTSRHLSLPPQARRVGWSAQHPALFPHLSVARNITLGIAHWTPPRQAARLTELLSALELHHLCDHLPAQLSGGQLQRVALARCLAPQPRLLLLDEPLASLDGPSRRQVRLALQTLLARWPVQTLLVTHHPQDIDHLADLVVVIEAGRVLQTGTPSELRHNPCRPLVRDLLTPESLPVEATPRFPDSP